MSNVYITCQICYGFGGIGPDGPCSTTDPNCKGMCQGCGGSGKMQHNQQTQQFYNSQQQQNTSFQGSMMYPQESMFQQYPYSGNLYPQESSFQNNSFSSGIIYPQSSFSGILPTIQKTDNSAEEIKSLKAQVEAYKLQNEKQSTQIEGLTKTIVLLQAQLFDLKNKPNVINIGSGSSGRGVHYGDKIILVHKLTKKHLHSHGINYKSGSRQQQVTCIGSRDDNDYFIVHPGANNNNKVGSEVNYGDTVRFEHVATKSYLHSHGGHFSPTTKQQEVTCYLYRDLNDDWVFQNISSKGKAVMPNDILSVLHLATKMKLHSHSQNFEVAPNNHQQEVTCFGGSDENDHWYITFN
jgi:hypothetical protein